eukprot:Pgem_evm1s11484
MSQVTIDNGNHAQFTFNCLNADFCEVDIYGKNFPEGCGEVRLIKSGPNYSVITIGTLETFECNRDNVHRNHIKARASPELAGIIAANSKDWDFISKGGVMPVKYQLYNGDTRLTWPKWLHLPQLNPEFHDTIGDACLEANRDGCPIDVRTWGYNVHNEWDAKAINGETGQVLYDFGSDIIEDIEFEEESADIGGDRYVKVTLSDDAKLAMLAQCPEE